MNTPITDGYKGRWATHFPDGITIYDLARRLELDRAALMEALETIIKAFPIPPYSDDGSGRRGFDEGSPIVVGFKAAESALATARANFPEQP